LWFFSTFSVARGAALCVLQGVPAGSIAAFLTAARKEMKKLLAVIVVWPWKGTLGLYEHSGEML